MYHRSVIHSAPVFRASLGLLTLASLLAGAPHAARAQTTTINVSDEGWYEDSGFHASANKDYIAGDDLGDLFRDYFVFDLSGITSNVTGASIDIYNPSGADSAIPGNPGYDGGSFDSDTFDLYSVAAPTATLEADHASSSTVGQLIYADLGRPVGDPYATVTVSQASNGSYVTLTLNAAAVSDINSSAGSTFALGGALTTAGSTGNYIFGYTPPTGTVAARLNVTTTAVPEPGIVVTGISMLSLTGHGLMRGRRRRKSA